MKKEFRGYSALNEAELQSLLKTAILSLDANILLNFFRFEREHRQVLFRILSNKNISPRLFVPYHAALEFYENLDEISSEPFTKIDDITRVIKSFKKENFSVTSDAKERSIYSDLYKRVSKDLDVLIKEVEKEKSKIQKTFDRKLILSELENTLEGKVGPPFAIDEIPGLVSECTIRQANRIPPGYGRDENKLGAYSFSGIALPKKCGDFFIWEQMLRASKKRQLPVIFITDDEKLDWIKRTAQGPIPRPELRTEFESRAGQDFYILNTKRFLSLVLKAFDAGIKISQVDEIGEIAKRQGNWKDEVYNALQQLGGEADLKDIYQQVKSNRQGNVPTSFESIVRKSIYHYSSGTDIFLNRENLYVQVAAGRWRILDN